MKTLDSVGADWKTVADFIIGFSQEVGDPVTNLKLQKLVYYSQAWYSANKGKLLFNEEFQAWVHGPVLPSLYRDMKNFGFSPIVKNIDMEIIKKNLNEVNDNIIPFLEELLGVYSPYTAYQLEYMTHVEYPWKNARGNLDPTENSDMVISNVDIKDFYGSKISKDDEQ